MENADAPFASSPNDCYFDDKTPQEDLKCEVRFNVNPNAAFHSVTIASTGEIAMIKYFKNEMFFELFETISSSKITFAKSVIQQDFISKLFCWKEAVKLKELKVKNLL